MKEKIDNWTKPMLITSVHQDTIKKVKRLAIKIYIQKI